METQNNRFRWIDGSETWWRWKILSRAVLHSFSVGINRALVQCWRKFDILEKLTRSPFWGSYLRSLSAKFLDRRSIQARSWPAYRRSRKKGFWFTRMRTWMVDLLSDYMKHSSPAYCSHGLARTAVSPDWRAAHSPVYRMLSEYVHVPLGWDSRRIPMAIIFFWKFLTRKKLKPLPVMIIMLRGKWSNSHLY